MKSFNESFYKRTALLLRVISFIKDELCFALKGGTAINLFVRDLPRLSVDIDLAYLPILPREELIVNINNALERIANTIQSKMRRLRVDLRRNNKEGIYKIYVSEFKAGIIIETAPVFRGSVYPSQPLKLCKLAQELFETDLEVNALSISDLYAGKICATLNRQHPRDLYDIKILLEEEGLNREIMQSFVIYLSGDRRPIHELLDCKIKQNQEELFKRDLQGMVREGIAYSEIENIVERLKKQIKDSLTDEEKKILISLAEGTPIWSLLKVPHVAELPALKWKVQNINKMAEEKRKKEVKLLQDCFML